jgi:hypothetical protein
LKKELLKICRWFDTFWFWYFQTIYFCIFCLFSYFANIVQRCFDKELLLISFVLTLFSDSIDLLYFLIRISFNIHYDKSFCFYFGITFCIFWSSQKSVLFYTMLTIYVLICDIFVSIYYITLIYCCWCYTL